jgi:hypothetical protein
MNCEGEVGVQQFGENWYLDTVVNLVQTVI